MLLLLLFLLISPKKKTLVILQVRYACFHKCIHTYLDVWSSHIARVPVLLVVSLTGKMNISLSAFAPENVVSRDGLGSLVPRQTALPISIPGLNLVLTYGIPPEFRGGVHLFIKTTIRHRVSPEFIGSRNCVPMAFTVESPPAQDQ